MNADTRARLAYLADCVDLLWPASDGTDRVVLPTSRRPRVLVPHRPWRAVAATLARYTAQQSAHDQAMAMGVAAAFGAGLLRPSPVSATAGTEGESIDHLLADVLGEPVRTSLALTHARPNRKPILQVFDRRGRTLAFTKVGVTPLARELVDAEARSLGRLAEVGLSQLRAPSVIDHRTWRDTSVLVTTALPIGKSVARTEMGAYTSLARAMHEVGNIGAGRDMPAYLASLRERAAALRPGAQKWTALVDRVSDAAGVRGLPTGSWHGDWTQWNCARARRGELAVWDWERFSTPVPAGFDMLHYLLNDIVSTGRGDYARAAREVVNRAAELLRDWTISAVDARKVAALYVLELGVRYRTDDTVQDVGRWVFPVVRSVLTDERQGAPR